MDPFEMMEAIAKNNSAEYNALKLCEELAELQEVLLKTHLKVPERRPDQSKIVDEIGDVILRIMGYTTANNLEDAVGQRIEFKASKLYKFYKEGKYKGGV